MIIVDHLECSQGHGGGMAARSGAYDHERFRRQLEREAARERAAREREAEKAAKEQHLQSRTGEDSALMG